MMWSVAVLLMLLFAYVPLVSYVEFKLYLKAGRFKKLLEGKKVLRNDKEILREYLRINMNEVFMFLLGFFVCMGLLFMGWM